LVNDEMPVIPHYTS